ncbi:c-type cytochrome [Oxalobacteraceae bacterium R-40]|uniref:C-type cytochrome n=1 Tax=Keguizhuia sedimenti TaxID=3064264 RepID=A0ABU1BTQ3_9BURK|nr:c-type cytochrome [Oxalobacteraceae bacterium R-40]
MSKKNFEKVTQAQAAPADEAFDPWEQGRPIPLFVFAVVFALGTWGVLTYFSEHKSQEKSAAVRTEQKAGETSHMQAALAAGQAPDSINPAAKASGLQNASPETLAIVGVGKGQAWSCASCHGEAGQGNLSTPRLAGLPAEYIVKQLHDFSSGLRTNESMLVVAKGLSSTEIEDVARYYEQIGLPSTVSPGMGGELERGRILAQQGDWKSNVPACFSCHGMSGEGVAPGFPALAGQQPDYIFAQLAAWQAGERKNSPQSLMDGIAKQMSVQDMRSVSDYLATLPLHPKNEAERAAVLRSDSGKSQSLPSGENPSKS